MVETIKKYQFVKDINRYLNKGVFKPKTVNINPILSNDKSNLNDLKDKDKIDQINYFYEFERLKNIKRLNNE